MTDLEDLKTKHFVINLERRPDRLEKFLQGFPKELLSELDVFKAVDGNRLYPENHTAEEKKTECVLNQFLDLEPSLEQIKNRLFQEEKLKTGEVGCFLSHLILWKQLLQENDCDFYIIFEDDAVFEPDFAEAYSAFQERFLVPGSAEDEEILLYFGGRFSSRFVTHPYLLEPEQNSPAENKTYCIREFKKKINRAFSNRMHFDRTTHAYLINKKAAHFLLSNLNEIKKDAVDHYMRLSMNQQEKKVLTFVPLPCYSNACEDTDVQKSKKFF